MKYRLVGFASMVAMLLVACGTAGSFPSSRTRPAPLCPSQPSIPPTTFCLSPAQLSAGFQVVHMTTIPDRYFIEQNFVLLKPRAGTVPRVSQAAAETDAREDIPPGYKATAQEARLVYLATFDGSATSGGLCWIVSMKSRVSFAVKGGPPGTKPPTSPGYLAVEVNPTSGSAGTMAFGS